MPILILFFFLIAAVVIWSHTQKSAKADTAWTEAAGRMKLRYSRKGPFGARRLSGDVDGYRVLVKTRKRSTGNSSTTYTHYELHFGTVGFDYKLKRAKSLSGVAKFFGAQDIEVGSEEFDRAVVVQSDKPKRVRHLLTPERQKAVLQLLLTYPGTVVKNGEIEWEEKGLATSAAKLEGVLRRFVRVARTLEGLPDVLPPEFEAPTSAEAPPAGVVARAPEVSSLPVGDHAPGPSADDLVEHGGPVHRLEPVYEPPTSAEPPSTREPATQAERVEEQLPSRVHAPGPVEVELVLPDPEPSPVPPVLPPLATQSRPTEDAASDTPASLPTSSLETQALGGSALEHDAPRPAPAAGEALDADAAEVCEDLFGGNQLGTAVARLFEEHYQDAVVTWTGTLERLDPYYSDFVFGQGPGTKAQLQIHRLEGDFGTRSAEALVQLDADASEALRDRIGQPLTFRGRLVKCEAFMRRLLVADGVLV